MLFARAFFLLGFALFFALLTNGSWAENRLAIIIGNSTYQSAGTLSNPTNDARLMDSTLKSVGFETRVLLDLTEAKMGEALDQLSREVSKIDVLVVYYAGHAIQIDGENYLIPVDANLQTEASVARQTIALSSIMKLMARVPVSVLLLDACRDNPFTALIALNEKSSSRSVKITRGIAVVRPLGDMLITFATLPNTVAFDGDGENSPFALALAKHIPTPDSEISVILKRVTGDVLERTSGKQRPQQLSQMQREFYFVSTPKGKKIKSSISSILSVYPDNVKVGDEVALVADVDPACQPAFFDISNSGRVTPLPRHFFKRVVLSSGHARHEISPGTRYGLKVLEKDEKGQHTLGFFCEPSNLNKAEKISLLKKLTSNFSRGVLVGQERISNKDVAYHFQNYTVSQ